MNDPLSFSFSIPVRAARAACQWRLLLLWVLWMLLPSAIVGLTTWHLLRASLDYSVHAAALAQRLDMTVLTDLMAAHGKHALAFNLAGLMALLATLLISPLLTGMAATAARAAGTPGMRELTLGGLSEYPRMLRMLAWSALPLGLAAALGNAALEAAAGSTPGSALALLATALLLVLAHASLDAGRAALAVERRRTSAVKAWWTGCRMLLARPLATLGAYLALSAAGLGLAALLALGRINLAGSNLAGWIGGLLLVQLAVAVLGWMRSARLFALIEVARSEKR